MDHSNWDDEDENSWLEQSYLDHTNDFNERFRENINNLRREIYRGKFVDDKVNSWMIDVVIQERQLRAYGDIQHTDAYEDDVLGLILICNFSSHYVDYLRETVARRRKLLGERIGELIAQGQHGKILKLSRSLQKVTERVKEVYKNECPAEILIQILRENYNKNLQMMREDAPANATGAAVAGTGDDPVHWRGRGVRAGFKGRKNKVGRSISALNFIKMRNKMMECLA